MSITVDHDRIGMFDHRRREGAGVEILDGGVLSEVGKLEPGDEPRIFRPGYLHAWRPLGLFIEKPADDGTLSLGRLVVRFRLGARLLIFRRHLDATFHNAIGTN
jgi:hypothetical protein